MSVRELTRAADSGTTLDAQTRYAGGAKGIIGRYFAGEAQNSANLIVIDGDVSFIEQVRKAGTDDPVCDAHLLVCE